MSDIQKKPNTLDNINVDYLDVDGKRITTTYKEFIELDPKTLEPSNLELFKVMNELHALNDRIPPLYKSFPDKKDKPLTIDATSILDALLGGGEKGAVASFNPRKNVVCFEKAEMDVALLDSLAHELKHAEQQSQELEEMEQTDGLSYHQIGYLKESQAYAFGDYVAALSLLNKGWNFDKISKTYPRIGSVLKSAVKNGEIDYKSYEEDGMHFHLSRLLGEDGRNYKKRFHVLRSIKDKDMGISKIPESLNITDKDFQKEFLEKLGKIPREAEEPGARLLQLLSDNHKVGAFVYSLKNKIKNKADKQKGGQTMLDSASITLATRMYNGTINPDEFEKIFKDLRRRGANMKDEDVWETFSLLASVDKKTFEILSKENVINKNNIGDVLKKASLKNNIDAVKKILEEIRTDSGFGKEEKKEIFQDSLWTATRKEHIDVIKKILKGCKEAKISMKDILTLEEPLLLMSLTMNKRTGSLDVILSECQKEGSLMDVLNAKDGDGKTIFSYISRYGLSDLYKKYSNQGFTTDKSVVADKIAISDKTPSVKGNTANQGVVSAAIQRKRMELE